MTLEATPERIGPYPVVRKLGHGGMGVVYEVTDPGVGRSLALKLLTQLGTRDPEERARLAREAQALARMRHPHVVRVHAAQLEGPRPYLVQELLPGGSLQDSLERSGPFPVSEALAIVRKLAGGLAHAHDQGVLHRDLKPANALLDERGEPKLVDFGLAAISGSSSLTATGTVMGTPAFMAPEQALGERDLDARTDVYGLTALLFALLTGRGPFADSGGAASTLLAVSQEPAPDLLAARPDAPAWVGDLCRRGLTKSPAERPPSARALLEALEAGEAGSQAPRQGWLGPALAVAAAAVVGGGWAWWTTTARPAPAPPSASPSLPPTPGTSEGEPAPLPWQRAEDSLAEDPAATLDLLGATPPKGDDAAERWRQLRASALLLTGEPEGARQLWRELGPASRVEQRRLELQASVDAGPQGAGWPPRSVMVGVDHTQKDTPRWLEDCAALLADVTRIEGVDEVRRVVRRRVSDTVGAALQACDEDALRGLLPQLGAIYRQSARLPATPGLDLARLLTHAMLGEPAPDVVANDSWSASQRMAYDAWRVASERVDRNDAAPASLLRPVPDRLPWLSIGIVEQAHSLLAYNRLVQSGLALSGEERPSTSELDQALAYCRQAEFHGTQQARAEHLHTTPTSLDLHYLDNRVAALLLRGDARRARKLLTDPGSILPPKARNLERFRLLLAECDLLEGRPTEALELLEGLRIDNVRGEEGQVDPHTARAAAYAQLGQLDRAHATLDQAPRVGSYLPWRSLEFTRAALNGDDRRALLIEHARRAGDD